MQNINDNDDDVLFYSNDNISFGIKELNKPFNTSYQNIQSPYLKAGSGIMAFEDNTKPKKINYDDILNSFNVQLQNGHLVLKSPEINSVHSPIFKSDPYQQRATKPYQSPRPLVKPVETKPVSLKNDSFYKYFKSHNVGNYVPNSKEVEEEQLPEMSPEELKEYRRAKFLEEEAQRQRIRQIKSKNMIFFNGVGEQVRINAQQGQTKGNMNKLFGFSNR